MQLRHTTTQKRRLRNECSVVRGYNDVSGFDLKRVTFTWFKFTREFLSQVSQVSLIDNRPRSFDFASWSIAVTKRMSLVGSRFRVESNNNDETTFMAL